MAIWELPLSGQPEKFGITFNGVQYLMRLTFADTAEGGWMLDIGAADGTPILCGVPLIPDRNLLEQHDHLAIGGSGSGIYLRNNEYVLSSFHVTQSFYVPPSFSSLSDAVLVFADGE